MQDAHAEIERLESVVGVLVHPRAMPVQKWHDHGCPITRMGKKYGPCDCPAAELADEDIERARAEIRRRKEQESGS